MTVPFEPDRAHDIVFFVGEDNVAGQQSYFGAASSSKASAKARPRAVSMRFAPSRFISGQMSEFAGTQRLPV